MTLRKTLLPTFQSVPSGVLAATATTTCDLPLGKRYHTIWLEVGDDGTASKYASPALVVDGTPATTGSPAGGLAASAAEFNLNNLIGQIRLLVNGTVQRTMTAFELNRLNVSNAHNSLTDFSVKSSGPSVGALNDGTARAGTKYYIPIFFAEPWRDEPEAGLTAWNATGVDSFQIQVDLQSGCSTPVISGFYEWDLPTANNIGVITKWKRLSLAATGSTQDFANISNFANRSKGDFLSSISLFPTLEATPKYVNKCKFTIDGVDYQDLLTTLENQAILLSRGMSPDTASTPRFDLVLDYDNPVNAAFPISTANSVNLHLEYNASASGTIIAIVQNAGLPE